MSRSGKKAGGGDGHKGGVFEDYQFRFANTYTAVDDDAKRQKNTAQRVAPPNLLTTSPATMLSCQPSSSAKKKTEEEEVFYLHRVKPKRRVDSIDLVEDGLNTVSTKNDIEKGIGGRASACVIPATITISDGLVYTNQYIAQLREQEEQQRRLRTKTTAESLLKYSRARKPNSMPLFRGAQPTRSGAEGGGGEVVLDAIGVESFMPVHRPLPAPALGLAAGIDIINGDSDLYAMTMAEKDAVRDSEKSRNERLFKWWENRQSARMLQYDREVLEKAIEGPLMDSVRELITSAESEWIEDYCRQQRNSIAAHPPRSGGPPTSSLMSGDGAAPRATGTDIMAQGSGISPVGATTRGVIVPINELETLFRNMRAHLHQRATALLVTYNESKAVEGHHADGEGGSLEASFAGILAGGRPRTDSTTKEVERVGLQHDVNRAMEVYISHFVETEKELTASAAEGLLPSTVSLPPERILPSALIIETATSAALLWKILSQVRTVVPGIDFALQLYHHYLLPHLYEGVVPYLSVLPDLGGISEQVAQLTQIPLRSQVSQWASEAAIQSKEDLRYMEHAMKHWAMRTWRRSVIAKRQAQIRNRSLTSLISRLRNQSLIRTVFDAWRFHTREDARTNYFRMIDQKYQLFLADSEVASRINAAGMMNPLSTHVGDVALGDKNKFIATKLAEAARHVKVQVKGHASIHEESISRRESAIASATLRSSIVDPLILTGGHSANRRTNSTDGSSPFLPAPPPRIGDLTPRQTNLEFLSTIGSKGGASIPSLPTQPSPTMMVAHRGSTATTKAGGSISGPPLALPPVPVPPHGNASSRPSSGVSAYTLENSANTMDLGEDHSMLAFQSVPQFTRSDMHETRATGTFDDMLAKLKDMEEVCGHLRQEIAVQTRMLQKVETEKRGLQEHNRKLEADLLKTVEEKLHFCNLVQQKQFLLNDRHRRILQLKSRIRSHRNRPWQRTLLRVVGELSGVNTHVAELLDDARVQRDVGSDGSLDSKSGEKGGEDKKAANLEYTTQHLREEEELRLFGSLAPIVLSSTRNLPDALQILQDWANGCLSDLQSLDDLKGGALSVQFSTFSEEARNGILLSRLLFYLALPRYLQRTANSDHMQQNAESSIVLKTVAEGEGGTAQAGEFPDRRRQLLEKRNVQLDSPFPVYSDCFGDLLNMMPSERMSLLLQFATELMAGTEVSISDSIDLKRKEAQDAVLAELDLSPPAPAARVELQEVIDPHALSMGERSAVVTFVALLYTRFSHPFNHKCRQSAEIEREAIIYLLSEGQSLQDRASARRHSSSRGSTEFTSADTERERRLLSTVEEEIMAHLEDEDKSPWQLFKERCIPVFGTNAHPFLLRGNFWPSDAFDSPQLAEVLGELGMALNRSLQLHRWHVTISCLVPVMTYAGISRGIFTGPRASPNALRVGLVRDDQWQLPLHGSCLSRIFQKRATLLRAAMQSGIFAAADVLAAPTRLVPDSESGGFVVEDTPLAVIPPTWCIDPEQIPVEEFVLREKAALMLALRNVSHDLLALFLRRSVLSAELALPTLDLGGWRLLCADLKLITMVPEEEEHYPLDMEAITIFFYDAVMSQGEWERPTSFTTNSTLASPRGGRSRNNPAAGGGGALSGSRGGTPPASSTILSETSGMVVAPLPTIRSDMAFPAFVTAVVLVANALYQLTNRDGQSSHGNNNNNKDAGDGAGAGGEAGSEVDLGSTVNSLQRSTELRPSSGRRTTNTTQRDGSADGSPRHHPGSPNPPSRKKVLRSYFDEDMPRPMKTRSILWAGDALMRFVCTRVGDATDTGRGDDPQSLAKRITRGIATQETLSWYTPALIVAFNAYSKDIFGSSGMEKEDLLRMLRDAMLTSTEISQYLIYELFQHCCVTRRAIEEEATAKRREIDGRPRDEPNKGRRNLRAVSIVDPRTNMVSSSQRKDVQILVYEGFVQFLCVLCYFKQPNPLIPFDQRLSVFLRRSLLRPLSHKVENLSQMLNRSKMAKELQQEDESSAAADGKPLRRGGAATAKM